MKVSKTPIQVKIPQHLSSIRSDALNIQGGSFPLHPPPPITLQPPSHGFLPRSAKVDHHVKHGSKPPLKISYLGTSRAQGPPPLEPSAKLAQEPDNYNDRGGASGAVSIPPPKLNVDPGTIPHLGKGSCSKAQSGISRGVPPQRVVLESTDDRSLRERWSSREAPRKGLCLSTGAPAPRVSDADDRSWVPSHRDIPSRSEGVSLREPKSSREAGALGPNQRNIIRGSNLDARRFSTGTVAHRIGSDDSPLQLFNTLISEIQDPEWRDPLARYQPTRIRSVWEQLRSDELYCLAKSSLSITSRLETIEHLIQNFTAPQYYNPDANFQRYINTTFSTVGLPGLPGLSGIRQTISPLNRYQTVRSNSVSAQNDSSPVGIQYLDFSNIDGGFDPSINFGPETRPIGRPTLASSWNESGSRGVGTPETRPIGRPTFASSLGLGIPTHRDDANVGDAETSSFNDTSRSQRQFVSDRNDLDTNSVDFANRGSIRPISQGILDTEVDRRTRRAAEDFPQAKHLGNGCPHAKQGTVNMSSQPISSGHQLSRTFEYIDSKGGRLSHEAGGMGRPSNQLTNYNPPYIRIPSPISRRPDPKTNISPPKINTSHPKLNTTPPKPNTPPLSGAKMVLPIQFPIYKTLVPRITLGEPRIITNHNALIGAYTPHQDAVTNLGKIDPHRVLTGRARRSDKGPAKPGELTPYSMTELKAFAKILGLSKSQNKKDLAEAILSKLM
jgi:hypothetical protein